VALQDGNGGLKRENFIVTVDEDPDCSGLSDTREMQERDGKEGVPAENTAPPKDRTPWESAVPRGETARAGLGEGDPLILLAEGRALDHVWKLMHDPEVPAIPGNLEGILLLQDIHRELCEIREVMKRYTVWDLDVSPESRGILPGYLKILQSNLRHIIWRMQMALEGDTAVRTNSMGKFSGVFDDLIQRMDRALEGLREKEAELCAMTEDPRRETDWRDPGAEARPGLDTSRRMTIHDDLTGALNRESFTFRALIELYAAFAQGRRCCLAVAAPDRFKDFSGRCGDPAGDAALKHAAKVFSVQMRKTDFTGRWNGEEFALFFQGMDPGVCRVVCERILQTLTSTPFNLREKAVHITASIGIAVADPDEFDISVENSCFPAGNTELIERLAGRAEEALYEAKRIGHNRVVISHSGPEKSRGDADTEAVM
jgi:diguanylate cyclase (GGDEF)-like protein